MKYTREEVMQYIAEEDVKFIRLAFCDIFGRQKNVSIVPEELKRAFSDGIAIDASAISGFGGKVHSDLFLHPDPSTLSVLPWRPENGKVVRMYCRVVKPDGTAFEGDTRRILGDAVKRAKEKGITFAFGSEMEFYLFKQDEQGEQIMINSLLASIVLAVWLCKRSSTFCVIPVQYAPYLRTRFQRVKRKFAEYSC